MSRQRRAETEKGPDILGVPEAKSVASKRDEPIRREILFGEPLGRLIDRETRGDSF